MAVVSRTGQLFLAGGDTAPPVAKKLSSVSLAGWKKLSCEGSRSILKKDWGVSQRELSCPVERTRATAGRSSCPYERGEGDEPEAGPPNLESGPRGVPTLGLD